jgi:hypothetical protein
MKVYLDNIKNIDWLNKLLSNSSYGKAFLSCTSPSYFVVYYNYIEEKSDIDIRNVEKKFNINDLIYREQVYSRSQYTGYLQEPYDSNNFLFYLLLRNLNPNATEEDKKKIDELFLDYKAKDLLNINPEEKLKIKYSFQIEGKSSYYDAISNILFLNPDCINGIQVVTDMIDNSVVKKLGYSFYAQVLKKIVLSLKDPDGGLIPEDGGTLRYMFVGERYFINDKLQTAKDLLRAGTSLEDIYLLTGWYWNTYDRKWRFRIPTAYFGYKSGSIRLIDYNGKSYNTSIPKKILDSFTDSVKAIEKMIELSKSDDSKRRTELVLELIALGYDTKFKDIFDYPELYSIYPEIGESICFLIQSDSPDNELGRNCYNQSEGIKHIVLSGGDIYTLDRLLTIAAHEIQHSIQDYEGFGNGGNPSFSKLLIAIGGGAFRKFFFLMSSFVETIVKKASLIPLEKWRKLSDDLDNSGDTGIIKVKFEKGDKDINVGKKLIDDTVELIKNSSNSENDINLNAQQLAYNFITIGRLHPKATNIIADFLKEEINYSAVELFQETENQIQNQLVKEDYLKSKGWSDLDIQTLNFRAYQYLVGEIESRYVQQSTKISNELLYYFTPYTSETVNPDEVNVYGNDIQFYQESSSQYGIELTRDGKYILHTRKSANAPYMILHEYGHILFDMLKQEHITEIQFGYDESSQMNMEEYFCESFVSYVVRKEIDKNLSDLVSKYSKNVLDNYDLLLDEFFTEKEFKIDESRLSDMLLFVNQILKYND